MANFEKQLGSLEAIVDRLERGDLSLDESVKLFEEGMQLSAACKQELEAAEGKIQKLVQQSNGKMAVLTLDVDTAIVPDERDER